MNLLIDISKILGTTTSYQNTILKNLRIIIKSQDPSNITEKGIGGVGDSQAACLKTSDTTPNPADQYFETSYETNKGNKSNFVQPSAVETHPNIVAQIIQEINNLINQPQATQTNFQQLREATINQTQ